jgi:Domain of unknown function (DUF4218)
MLGTLSPTCGSFFNFICSKVIDPEILEKLQADVVVILYQLVIYFPSSFFDIKVYLTIHLEQ